MTLSIAIVGFGRMAQNYYAQALKRLLPDARYAIVDPSVEAREQARRIFPEARCFAAVEELAGSGLDAALIASPPAAHFHAWRVLASRGVPIFMEKPFPLPSEIALVAELARSVSSPFMINFNRRFWAPYRQLLASAKSGAIGNVQAATLELITDPAKWKRPTDGERLIGDDGALQDLGGHLIDFTIALFGSLPATITAVSSNGADTLSMTLQWSDGRTVDARVGYGKTLEAIVVMGSLGSLSMYNPHGHIWKDQPNHSVAPLGAAIADLIRMSGYALRPGRTITRATTHAALGSFLGCLRTGAEPEPGLAEALSIARVLAAAEQSLTLARPVELAQFGKTSGPGES